MNPSFHACDTSVVLDTSEQLYPTKTSYVLARGASVLDAALQLVVTFAWVHFTGDTDLVTIALLVFSAFTVINAILNVLVRAVVKGRDGVPLRKNVRNVLSRRSFMSGTKAATGPSSNILRALSSTYETDKKAASHSVSPSINPTSFLWN